MASNIQDEVNAENLLISSDTDMEYDLSQLFDDSIDESHLLNYEEQHGNNDGHVTSDHETPQISEKPEITSNLKPDLHSSSLSQNESPCINHPTPETTVDKTLQPGVATGYVHNVSPIKNGKYFDFQLQMKHKTVRAVCFSPPKRKYFSEYSTSSTTVEIKKFKVDTNSNAEDLVMGNNVAVQYYPNIDFPKLEIPSSVTLATLSNVSVGQLVTVKAKVVHLSPIKVLQSKKLRMNQAHLVDPSGTIRIVLWEEFVSAVAEGNTYIFSDIRVKKDNHTNEIYVNTAKTGTKITASDPFTEILPITAEKPNEHNSTTLIGEILGVNKVQYYLTCCKCSKKVTFTESAIVKCQNCHLMQKQSSCAKQWYAQILFKHSSQTVNLTLFVDCIKQLIHQLPQAVDIETMTETSLTEILLSLPPTIEVMFQNRSKVVNTITVT